MDGFPLGSVESTVLTQGIAFLYAQAGELLRRRRASKDRAACGDQPPAALPPLEAPGSVFVPPGQAATSAELDVVDRLAGSIRQASREVGEYLASELPRGDAAGLAAADRLRCLLEEVYCTRLTFRGEQRDDRQPTVTRVHAPKAGVVLSGDVRVYGDVAGRDIKHEK
jgi:hypothetical protein